MVHIVSLKFCIAGRHYHFRTEDPELLVGDIVVVETARGRSLATVVSLPEEVSEDKLSEDTKSVLRKATSEDLLLEKNHKNREKEAFEFCRKCIEERRMLMKLVRAEYLFDGSKIIFYFTADGRIDFRELVKDLAHQFHTRIEMKQIGVRDEAKLIGGIGICGRELCCCTFLTEFSPVSVKMAKEQGLALNPSKISGQCGRLLCCLSYEFDTYCKLKKKLPKTGEKVTINGREGLIIDVNVINQKITLRMEDRKLLTVSPEELSEGLTKPAKPELSDDFGKTERNRTMPSPPPPSSSPSPSKKSRKKNWGKKPAAKAGQKTDQRPGPKPASKPAQTPVAETEAAPKRKRSRSRRKPTKKIDTNSGKNDPGRET